MNWRKCSWISMLIVSIVLSSCGVNIVSKTTGGLLNSASSFDNVFTACVQSLADVGFSVTSQDKASGFLAAVREDITGEDKMNVTVKKVAGGIEVDVAIVSLGISKDMFSRYATALQRRVPDISIVSKR